MDKRDDDGNHEEPDSHVEEQRTTPLATPQSKKKKKAGRGPGKSESGTMHTRDDDGNHEEPDLHVEEHITSPPATPQTKKKKAGRGQRKSESRIMHTRDDDSNHEELDSHVEEQITTPSTTPQTKKKKRKAVKGPRKSLKSRKSESGTMDTRVDDGNHEELDVHVEEQITIPPATFQTKKKKKAGRGPGKSESGTMDTRDDDGNHEENDSHVEEQITTPPASPQTNKKKKAGRGPGKSVKSSEPMLLEFDELNFPTGDWEWKYGQQIGRCALRIDINFHKWSDVEQEIKDILWVETQKLFHIYDPKGVRKRNFLRALAARFRNLKSRLASRFIEKKKAPNEGNPNANKKPWEVYAGYITEEQWNSFEEYVTSEEFKKRSQVGKQCAKGNIHRHTLGQKSYSRKRVDWIKEKRLPPPNECSTRESTWMNERLENRALEWCLAHQVRSRDGKWEVDPKKPETARLVSQVMEHLEKEANKKEEGVTSSSERGVDALSKAIGRKDYHGYVKGLARFGVGVGHRQAFGKLARQGRTSSQTEQIEALKATLTEEFAREKATLTQDLAREKAQLTQEFEVRLQERVAVEVQAYIAKLPSLDMPASRLFSSPNAPQPPTTEESKKCRLGVNDEDGNLVVVAEGRAHHIHAGVLHSSCVLPDHYKVSIDNPFEEHSSVLLPVPSDDGVTELGKAKNCFVQWPRSMVLFEDLESGVGIHQHLGEGLTEECEMLQLVMVDDKHDAIRVSLKAPLLYFQEDKDVWVTYADISKFIRGAYLNVSLIHIYILCLVEEFVSGMKGRNISFLCPQRISGAECKRSFLEVLAYVKQAFWSELQKKEAHCKFILAPYSEDNHWILMVIDLRAGVVFQFDPVAQQHPRQLSCDSVFQYAYKSYRSRIKARDMPNSNSKLVVKQMECPQQTGGIECGYYVMRYMCEIVTLHSECKGDLQQEYIGRFDPYRESEMAEVRDQWARFFRESFLLP